MIVRHTIPHNLDVATACGTIDAAFDSYRQRYADRELHLSWINPLHARVRVGVRLTTLEGHVRVFADRFEIEVDVPFWALPFRWRTIRVLDHEARRWMREAKKAGVRDG